MKGTLKLLPIDKPVEGMQVVWQSTVLKITSISPLGGYVSFEPILNMACRTSEIKQIVIEYNRYEGADNVIELVGTGTLCLHPGYWEKALPLIGKECNFDIEDTKEVEKYEDDGSVHGEVTWKKVAKLILPKQEEELVDCHVCTDGNIKAYPSVVCSKCKNEGMNFKAGAIELINIRKRFNPKQEESWDDVWTNWQRSSYTFMGGNQRTDDSDFYEWLKQTYPAPKRLK